MRVHFVFQSRWLASEKGRGKSKDAGKAGKKCRKRGGQKSDWVSGLHAAQRREAQGYKGEVDRYIDENPPLDTIPKGPAQMPKGWVQH